jgi:hypothetical protein
MTVSKSEKQIETMGYTRKLTMLSTCTHAVVIKEWAQLSMRQFLKDNAI